MTERAGIPHEDSPENQPSDELAAILLELLETPPGDRDRLLEECCGSDLALLEKLRSLLSRERESEEKLIKGHVAAPAYDDQTIDVIPAGIGSRPEHVGPYRILDTLGEGGMGVVYLAEQREPVRRRVALKLIKLGMDTQEVVARFKAERQALAMMSHPGIAGVYDAGSAQDGRPYFVMELVEGISITDFCDRHKLDVRQRLELCVQACRAIQHAHQRGVIHRDLKPSNILVSSPDRKPVCKVIDFGVAKATNQALTEKTIYTELGRAVGTPAYMSPEQAEMSAETIDQRSDVYSLGAILYELLVGEQPLDWEMMSKSAYDEILRRIREDEPLTPSTRLSRLNIERSRELSRSRRTSPSSLVSSLRGDLDWITMKALEKDPIRRYESAAELAEDLERHIAGKPIKAGPPGGLYRLRKYVARHRGPIAIASFALLLLVIALAGAVFYAFEQRELAKQQTKLADDKTLFANEKQKALRQVEGERQKARSDLYRSLVGEARALRLARQSGFRTQAFELLKTASQMDVPERDMAEIEREVLACLPDAIGLEPEEDPRAEIAKPEVVPSDVRQVVEDFQAERGSIQVAFDFDPSSGYLAIATAVDVFLFRGDEVVTSRKYRPKIDRRLRHVSISPRAKLLTIGVSNASYLFAVPSLDGRGIFPGFDLQQSLFHPWGHLLATTPNHHGVETLVVRDLRTLQIVARLERPRGTRISWSNSGRHLLATRGEEIVRAWRFGGTPERSVLAGHDMGVTTLAYHPSGRFLVSSSHDRTVRVWNVADRRLEANLAGHSDLVQSFAFDSSARTLASVGGRGEILFWDFDSRRLIARRSFDGTGRFWEIVFAPLDRFIATGSDTGVRIWAYERTGDEVSLDLVSHVATEMQCRDLLWSPSGTELYISSLTNSRLLRLDLMDGTPPETLDVSHHAWLQCIELDPTGRKLIHSQRDLALAALELKTGRSETWNVKLSSASQSLSRDGRWAVFPVSENSRGLYSLEADEFIWIFPPDPNLLWAGAISPDGEHVAISTNVGEISIWHLEEVRARLAEFGIDKPRLRALETPPREIDPASDWVFDRLLARIENGEATADELLQRLSAKDVRRRRLAIVGLGALGDEAKPSIERLEALLSSDDEPTRLRAAEALFAIDPESARRLVEPLRGLLSSADPYIQEGAAKLLGTTE